MTDELPVPRPILAAWLAVMTRGDLSPALTDPSQPEYQLLLKQFGFSGEDQEQWEAMLHVFNSRGGIAAAQAAINVWVGVTKPGWPTPSCPPDGQLIAIAQDRADA